MTNLPLVINPVDKPNIRVYSPQTQYLSFYECELNTCISIDRFYKDNKAEFESCTFQAEAEMDDLTLLQQQQQDLERQKLVSAMAAGIQWSLLRDLLTLLFYIITKHGCAFCSYFTCYPDCLSCM